MALFVPERTPLPDPLQKAQHFVPPSLRERRAQAVHRLQIGLFGLAGMLLLVGLANIIMDRAMISDDAGEASSAAAASAASVAPEGAETPASDPLADIGVVPDMPAAETPAAPPATGETGSAGLPDG